MEKIVVDNWNPSKTCNEQHCDKDITRFQNVEIGDFKFIISLCKKHAEQFDEVVADKLRLMEIEANLYRKPFGKSKK